jgi:hypothetical protein
MCILYGFSVFYPSVFFKVQFVTEVTKKFMATSVAHEVRHLWPNAIHKSKYYFKGEKHNFHLRNNLANLARTHCCNSADVT